MIVFKELLLFLPSSLHFFCNIAALALALYISLVRLHLSLFVDPDRCLQCISKGISESLLDSNSSSGLVEFLLNNETDDLFEYTTATGRDVDTF